MGQNRILLRVTKIYKCTAAASAMNIQSFDVWTAFVFAVTVFLILRSPSDRNKGVDVVLRAIAFGIQSCTYAAQTRESLRRTNRKLNLNSIEIGGTEPNFAAGHEDLQVHSRCFCNEYSELQCLDGVCFCGHRLPDFAVTV